VTPAPGAGVFVPYALIDALGVKNMTAVFVAATIEHLYRTVPFLARDGAWVRMSVRELAQVSHLTDGQVRRSLDLLVDVGLLVRRIHQVPDGDAGRLPYSYRLVPDISAVAA
jgi:hypothetical protein